jgi:hypothetical protein
MSFQKRICKTRHHPTKRHRSVVSPGFLYHALIWLIAPTPPFYSTTIRTFKSTSMFQKVAFLVIGDDDMYCSYLRYRDRRF